MEKRHCLSTAKMFHPATVIAMVRRLRTTLNSQSTLLNASTADLS
jgi:hypothetical protein